MEILDLRALEIFRTVATEGSISKAARKLHRVQSNISTRVKQLEVQVGRELFLRKHRGLALTSDGVTLLSYADRLLQLSREASEAINEGEPAGDFRVGAMESTAAARLPEVLSRFVKVHPKVQVALETGTSGALLTKLVNHEIDVAFVAEPVGFEAIDSQVVFVEELILVVPESFPEHKNTSELSGKQVIAFEAGCAYRRYIEDWLLEVGIVPGGIMTVSSYLSILACVAAGTGYAVMPQSVLDLVNAKGQSRQYPLPKKYGQIKTVMAWCADYHSSKLEALKDLLQPM